MHRKIMFSRLYTRNLNTIYIHVMSSVNSSIKHNMGDNILHLSILWIKLTYLPSIGVYSYTQYHPCFSPYTYMHSSIANRRNITVLVGTKHIPTQTLTICSAVFCSEV